MLEILTAALLISILYTMGCGITFGILGPKECLGATEHCAKDKYTTQCGDSCRFCGQYYVCKECSKVSPYVLSLIWPAYWAGKFLKKVTTLLIWPYIFLFEFCYQKIRKDP